MTAERTTLRPAWRTPSPRRLPGPPTTAAEVMRRHDESVDQNSPAYADPVSGFSVFTAAFLAARGYCCDSGCRHCPYLQE